MTATLSPEDVRNLLEELAQRLHAAGVSAGIRVVGGAALSILDESRRATSDVDAVIVPSGIAAEVVMDIAKERGLPANWFNDAAMAR